MDATGKIIFSESIKVLEKTINVSELKEGVYFLEIKNQHEILKSKFIKLNN